MGLAGGREVLGDADVELLRADAEPDAAARREQRRLLHLVEPEQSPKNRRAPASHPDGAASWTWSTPTSGVIGERPDAPRDPGPGKANPLLQVGALPTSGDTLGRTRAPFV